MRKWILIVACGLVLAGMRPAYAEVSAEDMVRVREQIRLGNMDNAIRLLQDLQVDAPDSPFVQFGLGEAFSIAAEQAEGTGDFPTAIGYLESARRAFEAAAQAEDSPSLSANAHYNAANVMTRMGRLMVEGDQYQGAVQHLQGALETYDTALAREPEHPGARHNRAYTRWALKQLLLEEPPPPPEPEPQPQPEGEEEEDEGEDEQEQQQPEGEEEEETEQEQPEGQDEQDGEEEQDPGEAPEPPPSPEDDSDTPQEPEDMPMQDFEALLDNLMDIDDEEQRNLRREPRSQQLIREWW